ncbi:MAG: arylsulfatase [Planctomycetota bacterium]
MPSLSQHQVRTNFLPLFRGGHALLASLITLVLMGICGNTGLAADRPDKPNIIYILLDDAGYGDLSCYGQKKFETPNIDRLAKEGMRFTQHYSGSTVCAPTRCCLMTGMHTGHAVVRGNREVKPEGQAPMPADIVTIPRLLQSNGYVTGAFGKWGLGAPGSPSDPAEHFDLFFGYNCQREAHTYYPNHLWKNKEKVPMDGETHSADVIQAAALDFVRSNKDKPFFMFVPTTIPHAAMHATEDYLPAFKEKFSEFNGTTGKYAGTETDNPIAAFAAMMTQVDDHVGQIVDLLQELSLDENTIILLSSDNGPHREGGHDPEFFNSNGALRGHKRDLYEGGIRAPLIARWPGQIEADSVSSLISAHWDMLPTFCELAKVDPPSQIDGISIVNELTGDGEQAQHEYLYWEFYERGGKRAARIGDWKAVQLNLNKRSDPAIELYHLPTDVSEKRDVATEHPDLISKAKSIFTQASAPSEFWSFRGKK